MSTVEAAVGSTTGGKWEPLISSTIQSLGIPFHLESFATEVFVGLLGYQVGKRQTLPNHLLRVQDHTLPSQETHLTLEFYF